MNKLRKALAAPLVWLHTLFSVIGLSAFAALIFGGLLAACALILGFFFGLVFVWLVLACVTLPIKYLIHMLVPGYKSPLAQAVNRAKEANGVH